MNVDPVDDYTSWYTGDATAANGSRQSTHRQLPLLPIVRPTSGSLRRSPPAHPNAGDEIVYRITVFNDGPITAAERGRH